MTTLGMRAGILAISVTGLFFVAGAAAETTPLPADDTPGTGPNVMMSTASKPASSEVLSLVTAGRLVDHARKTNDAAAMVSAANLLKSVKISEAPLEHTSEGGKPDTTLKTDKAVPTAPNLLAEAVPMAKGDKSMLAVIQKAQSSQ